MDFLLSEEGQRIYQTNAFGPAEINELVDIVHDAALAHNAQCDHRAAQRADGQSLRPSAAKDMIGPLAAAAPSMSSTRMVGLPGMCFFK